ncbi:MULTISPECIES: bestrophin-like domain [unclassified Caulobacter]|jgi:hypothetical protein|uniref:bestrophin-like domain n=1 Tax=unclassified Caulobacter TaxID=2648921 RepID=UPI000B1814B4|nr:MULTISPECIES: hypothetical protein [unclassified Caulobacter]
MTGGFATWLETTPAWLIGLILLAAMFAASLLGEWLSRRTGKTKGEGGDDGGKEGYIVSATLGLLALLMGFTFSLAVDRFESRRMLVLEEANAIGTTYLRTQMLEPVDRARISRMLVDYTDNRITLAKAPPDQVPTLLARNDQMLTDLWTATLAAWPSIKGLDFSSSYLDTMNTMIDLDSARKAARLARVPSTVFFVLFVYVVTSAGVLGYAGANKEGRGATAFLFLLLTISLLLTLDIDRPRTGRVTESQAPMERLRATMATQPPEVFDRMSAPKAAPTPAAPPKGATTGPGR